MLTVVTGHEGTLGRAVTERLEAQGVDVCGVSRSSGTDVRNEEALERNYPDHVGAVVTCAGKCIVKPLDEMTIIDWHQVNDINVMGTLLAVRKGVQRGAKRIVTVGSLLGSFPMAYPDRTAYITSKAAVAGLTRALAVELAPEGVSVNCVAPGHFTLMANKGSGLLEGVQAHSPGGLVSAGDAASVIAWLVTDAPAALTGQVIVVDGGYTLSQYPEPRWWNDD